MYDFDAPSPTMAYGQIPDAPPGFPTDPELAAALAFLPLRRQLGRHQGDHTNRVSLLHNAAALDLHAVITRDDEGAAAALRAALALRQHDIEHGGGRGVHPPDGIEWDGEGGPRAYIRQEVVAARLDGLLPALPAPDTDTDADDPTGVRRCLTCRGQGTLPDPEPHPCPDCHTRQRARNTA